MASPEGVKDNLSVMLREKKLFMINKDIDKSVPIGRYCICRPLEQEQCRISLVERLKRI